MNDGADPASFRDPSGYIFLKDGDVYRRINNIYKDHYNYFIESGLYRNLIEKGFLIEHEEIGSSFPHTSGIYLDIKPNAIKFISYPYEWSFSQLKDAALLTLEIQLQSLEYGMTLKDASAYNVQFENGKPIFIDTLSFEKYEEGKPWIAYKQFCENYFSPLVLMAKLDVRLQQLLKVYIDGIPVDLASKLLSKKTYLLPSILAHIHLLAWSERKYSKKVGTKSDVRPIKKKSLSNFIKSLATSVSKLKWKPEKTEWCSYYSEKESYKENSLIDKFRIVSQILDIVKPSFVWDIGANIGAYSRIASDRGIRTISFDIDPACVELNYLEVKNKNQKSILPLLLDITNPSPAIGWQNCERAKFMDRGKPELIMALALIHHLAISKNIPLSSIASFLAELTSYLIIEFIPKSDFMVKNMLCNRADIFPKYNSVGFEVAFTRYFSIEQKQNIYDSDRTLYLMKKI